MTSTLYARGSIGCGYGCGAYSVQHVGALGMRRPDVDVIPCGRNFSGDESFIEDVGSEGTEEKAASREGGLSQEWAGAGTKRASDSKL